MARFAARSLASAIPFAILLATIATTTTTIHGQQIKTPEELCDNHNGLDLSPLRDLNWAVSSPKHDRYFDIRTCDTKSVFNDACKGFSVCEKKSDNKFVGYNPVSLSNQYQSWRVHYIGPACKDGLNHTLDISFSCGDHLGYPTYPMYSMVTECSTILHWETSAACSKETAQKINEHQCYVIDPSGNRRDLTPLMKVASDYKVQASNGHPDMFINVCAQAKSCQNNVAACIVKDSSTPKKTTTIGTYKRHSLNFRSKNKTGSHSDYIELTYKDVNKECLNAGSNTDDAVVITTVRFICPKDVQDMPWLKRHPVLVSDLECRYDIDWVTEHACPQEDIQERSDSCVFPQNELDFSTLKLDKDSVFSHPEDGRQIFMNMCDNLKNPICGKNSVCVVANGTVLEGTANQKDTLLMKHDGGYHLEYSIAKKCTVGKDVKDLDFVINFECGTEAGQPVLTSLDNCRYEFLWKTSLVCDKFKEPLDCQIQVNNLNFDLSSLTQTNGSSMFNAITQNRITKYLNDDQELILNVCGPVGRVDKKFDCGKSAACIIDRTANTVRSLGHFTEDFKFNDDVNELMLNYSKGDDGANTQILFFCARNQPSHDVSLIQVQNKSYKILFKSPAACPLEEATGQDCQLDVPGVGSIDLRPLMSETYYSIKTLNYDFELNVCKPVIDEDCGLDIAICQKEKAGSKRTFSLGKYSSASLKHWNGLVNMTFVDGTQYNDAKKTPRKSHITFICDPKAGRGEPEFDEERGQGYHFRWYTSHVCPSKSIQPFDCSWHNQTHYFDLNMLQMDFGNHHETNSDGNPFFINFCGGLNPLNTFKGCRPDNGVCLIEYPQLKPLKMVARNLGIPVGPPVKSFEENTFMLLYNNGDQCPHNKSLNITTLVTLKCDTTVDNLARIQMLDNFDDGTVKTEALCNYQIVVSSKFACPRPFTDLEIKNCVYRDPRTNLTINLNDLERQAQVMVKSSEFRLDMCGSVVPFEKDTKKVCEDAAVCYRDADNTISKYGSKHNPVVYFERKNFHVRFNSDEMCHEETGKNKFTDVEFICDPDQHSSLPILQFRDSCAAKFTWNTSLVCHLGKPTCSLLDESTNMFYSLSPLSSKSHHWTLKHNNNEEFAVSVCSPMSPHFCSGHEGSAACRCKTVNDRTTCDNIGQVSAYELIIDPHSKDLVLRYEDGDRLEDCQGAIASTQINFRCSKNSTGIEGPKLVNVSHCDHYFVWDTVFACPIAIGHTQLDFDHSKMLIEDKDHGVGWNVEKLFEKPRTVIEHRKLPQADTYEYVFDFRVSSSLLPQAAVSQIRQNKIGREIGSKDPRHWRFDNRDGKIVMSIDSGVSKCGTNKQRMVSTKIFFECSTDVQDELDFLTESQDCEYFFIWKTHAVCDFVEIHSASSPISGGGGGGYSIGWTLFFSFFVVCGIFALWLGVSKSSARDDVVFHIRKAFRRDDQPEIPFRYQQSEDEEFCLPLQL